MTIKSADFSASGTPQASDSSHADAGVEPNSGPPDRDLGNAAQRSVAAQVATSQHAPLLPDEEWANALTHATAALAWMFGALLMARAAAGQSLMTTFCCLVFVVSAVSVFTASALSHHLIHCPRLLNRLRAWDQGLIYVMISGTYTPLIWRFADESIRGPLLVAIWIAAAIGFHSKVIAEHRVNGIGTITYLLLGWLPALALVGKVPREVLLWMALGGVIYTLGVALLLNDKRFKYLHAAWHLCVVTAATCHFWAVYQFVATA